MLFAIYYQSTIPVVHSTVYTLPFIAIYYITVIVILLPIYNDGDFINSDDDFINALSYDGFKEELGIISCDDAETNYMIMRVTDGLHIGSHGNHATTDVALQSSQGS